MQCYCLMSSHQMVVTRPWQANGNMKASSAVRISIGLNFAVFYYEVFGDRRTGITILRQLFDSAVAELNSLDVRCALLSSPSTLTAACWDAGQELQGVYYIATTREGQC